MVSVRGSFCLWSLAGSRRVWGISPRGSRCLQLLMGCFHCLWWFICPHGAILPNERRPPLLTRWFTDPFNQKLEVGAEEAGTKSVMDGDCCVGSCFSFSLWRIGHSKMVADLQEISIVFQYLCRIPVLLPELICHQKKKCYSGQYKQGFSSILGTFSPEILIFFFLSILLVWHLHICLSLSVLNSVQVSHELFSQLLSGRTWILAGFPSPYFFWSIASENSAGNCKISFAKTFFTLT